MAYLGFCVTHDGVKPIDKNTGNKKYRVTNFLKRGTSVYRFSELIAICGQEAHIP